MLVEAEKAEAALAAAWRSYPVDVHGYRFEPERIDLVITIGWDDCEVFAAYLCGRIGEVWGSPVKKRRLFTPRQAWECLRDLYWTGREGVVPIAELPADL